MTGLPTRTAIITGGAKRIGGAITRALAADGWYVLIHCNQSLAEAEELHLGDRRDHPVDALVGERDCVAGDPLVDGRVHGRLEAELGGGSDCGRLLRIARYRAR